MSSDLIMVYTLCATLEQAEMIAQTLLDEKLIACANIGAGVTSHYMWKGERAHVSETPLYLKTLASHYEKVEARVAALQEYEVPFVCALPVDKVYPSYMQWVRDSVV